MDIDAENVAPAVTNTKSKKTKKTVEERYQKLSQLEHILLRPDTYIGSKCLRDELLFSILLLLLQLAHAHPTYFSLIFHRY